MGADTKKKRRLEKYIDKKLKKEERVVIFEKLSKSQAELPSTLNLHSSSTLGTGKSTSIGSALKRSKDQTSSPTKPTAASNKKWTGVPVSTTDNQPDSDTSFDSSDSDNDSEDRELDENQDAQSSGCESNRPSQAPKNRSLGFKQWAMKQLSTAKGYDAPTSSNPDDSLPEAPPAKKRKIDPAQVPLEKHGPLGDSYQLPVTSFSQLLTQSNEHVKVVTVDRPQDVQEARLLLPIVAEEQPIMEAILLNPVVIICGETGSGKTTQVPQFLYEAGFGTLGSQNPGMIGVTQPRRVAAMSMASRVAHELSLTSSKVSYQIRYDATVSPDTSIKFMTDGVLLRELATDFLLTKYSAIIIDEAHERSMNTDILIGVLSRVMKLRENMWKEDKEGIKPLRLIIMSATLRVSDFADNKALFPSPPPVINVPGRQHPVTVHFSRRTSPDYVNEAIRKAAKIHTRLPPGGILLFLTGQNEITGVCRRLESMFGQKAHGRFRKQRASAARDDSDVMTAARKAFASADVEAEEMDLGLDTPEDIGDIDEHEILDEEALDSEDDGIDPELGLNVNMESYMHVVPLFSLLPSDKQMKVFEPPPPNSRLVVVSTNVAETSLTIPGIRYVVDCGRAKERRYDTSSGIQSFQVTWVSKASASQRAGRAGRTGPGHCYRLYSSALYEHHFDQFTQPEILRTPVEGIVLQMKSMHIDVVANFPFPTPPDQHMLRLAEKTLTHLGALHNSDAIAGTTMDALTTGGQITTLGKNMALFPLHPRFSRMLVSGQQHGCLPYVIAIVASLAVGDPFIHEEGLTNDVDTDKLLEGQRDRRKAYFQTQSMHASLGNSTSDLFKTLSVVGAYEYAGGGHQFCGDHFVRIKLMEEIHKLRAQISNIVSANFPGVHAEFSPKLPPPNEVQLKSLRQLVTAAFIDQVAIRKDLVERSSSSGIQYSTSKGVPYRALGIGEDVFIHPSSVTSSTSPPEYVVYSDIIRTSRAWLKGVTTVNPAWLATLGKAFCSFSKPSSDNKGQLMTIPYFGPHRWELPPIKYKDGL